MLITNPSLVNKTKILTISNPYGIPPVVVRPDLPKEVRDRLQTVLLEMHSDPEGQNILEGMAIKRFVSANDSAYDGIRAIERFIRLSDKR